MRQIDEDNFMQDKKLNFLTEKLNYKISSLEGRVKHLEVQMQANPSPEKAPRSPSEATFRSKYHLDTKVTLEGREWFIVEVAFDRVGVVYTLQAKDVTMDRKFVSEDHLVFKEASRNV